MDAEAMQSFQQILSSCGWACLRDFILACSKSKVVPTEEKFSKWLEERERLLNARNREVAG